MISRLQIGLQIRLEIRLEIRREARRHGGHLRCQRLLSRQPSSSTTSDFSTQPPASGVASAEPSEVRSIISTAAPGAGCASIEWWAHSRERGERDGSREGRSASRERGGGPTEEEGVDPNELTYQPPRSAAMAPRERHRSRDPRERATLTPL